MEKTSLLYSSNGTLQVINIESSSPVAEAIIIIICYLFAVCYNLIITAAVLYNNQLRISSFYVLLLEVCLTCLLDCLTNESIAFELLLNTCTPLCGFSAAVFHLFLLSHSSSLGLLLLERTLSLKDHFLTVRVALGGVLVSWVFSLIFVSPLFGAFEVHYFPNRNACSAVKTNMWFPVFTLLGFLLTWGLMATGVFELICYIKKYLSDRKQLDVLSIFPSSNSEIQNPVLPIASCSRNQIAFTITFLYSVLLLPVTISYCVTLFFTPKFETSPWIDPRVPTNKTRSVISNSLEPLFTYSRYMYNAVVPIIILSSDRDIRLQSRQVFCPRRNVISSFDQSVRIQTPVQVTKLATVYPCSLNTPVLFATSRGLHLRTTQNNQSRYREGISDSKSKVRLMMTFCDLTINSTIVERGSYEFNQTVKVSHGEGHVRNNRCVRFSSQVEAISAPESRFSVWSSAGTASQSSTRTITSTLYEKGESHGPNNIGNTYTKM